jgi:hypothetical protein
MEEAGGVIAPTMSPQSPEPPVPAVGVEADADPASLSTQELIQRLQQDRQWLLRQIDAGRWPGWRLDLAALERELGLLLEQASERERPS